MKITSNYTILNKNNINLRASLLFKSAGNKIIADTLEISNKNNISQAADLIPKKYINMLRERFFRDYTVEEILDMKNRYAEIINISDRIQFLRRACQELKKDYGIENIPTKLNTEFKSYNYANGINPKGKCAPHYDEGYIEIGIDTKSQSNQSLFRIIAHELRHVLQTVKCYQHSSNQEYANALLEKYRKCHQFDFLTDEEIMNRHITPVVNSMAEFFENNGIKKLDKTDAGYNFGRKILKSHRTPANSNLTAYIDAYHERDAKETENLMYNIAYFLNNKYTVI